METMEKIDIRDLSIGDWVEIDGEPAKALCLRIVGGHIFKGVSGQMYRCCGGMDFEPIPITPEILENNGWSKKYDDVWVCGVWRISQINKCLFVLYNEKHDYDFLVYIDTVHQLQHALRLAGVEKEIEL